MEGLARLRAMIVDADVLDRLRELAERISHRIGEATIEGLQLIDLDAGSDLDVRRQVVSLDELDQDFAGL